MCGTYGARRRVQFSNSASKYIAPSVQTLSGVIMSERKITKLGIALLLVGLAVGAGAGVMLLKALASHLRRSSEVYHINP